MSSGKVIPYDLKQLEIERLYQSLCNIPCKFSFELEPGCIIKVNFILADTTTSAYLQKKFPTKPISIQYRGVLENGAGGQNYGAIAISSNQNAVVVITRPDDLTDLAGFFSSVGGEGVFALPYPINSDETTDILSENGLKLDDVSQDTLDRIWPLKNRRNDSKYCKFGRNSEILQMNQSNQITVGAMVFHMLDVAYHQLILSSTTQSAIIPDVTDINDSNNCPFCRKEFKSLKAILSHISVKHGLLPYLQERFGIKSQLGQQYECNLCHLKGTKAAAFADHLTLSHSVEVILFFIEFVQSQKNKAYLGGLEKLAAKYDIRINERKESRIESPPQRDNTRKDNLEAMGPKKARMIDPYLHYTRNQTHSSQVVELEEEDYERMEGRSDQFEEEQDENSQNKDARNESSPIRQFTSFANTTESIIQTEHSSIKCPICLAECKTVQNAIVHFSSFHNLEPAFKRAFLSQEGDGFICSGCWKTGIDGLTHVFLRHIGDCLHQLPDIYAEVNSSKKSETEKIRQFSERLLEDSGQMIQCPMCTSKYPSAKAFLYHIIVDHESSAHIAECLFGRSGFRFTCKICEFKTNGDDIDERFVHLFEKHLSELLDRIHSDIARSSGNDFETKLRSELVDRISVHDAPKKRVPPAFPPRRK